MDGRVLLAQDFWLLEDVAHVVTENISKQSCMSKIPEWFPQKRATEM